ncbi:MAG: hypothetical protein COA78_04925 [Blastopirellula sp.]|nr:MAG: hypothetical protein COA78_04925 [Blastopirellula sp.]
MQSGVYYPTNPQQHAAGTPELVLFRLSFSGCERALAKDHDSLNHEFLIVRDVIATKLVEGCLCRRSPG